MPLAFAQVVPRYTAQGLTQGFVESQTVKISLCVKRENNIGRVKYIVLVGNLVCSIKSYCCILCAGVAVVGTVVLLQMRPHICFRCLRFRAAMADEPRCHYTGFFFLMQHLVLRNRIGRPETSSIFRDILGWGGCK